jgi:hypothetical protein
MAGGARARREASSGDGRKTCVCVLSEGEDRVGGAFVAGWHGPWVGSDWAATH